MPNDHEGPPRLGADREFIVRVTRLPRDATEATATDFVKMAAATDGEAADRALDSTRLRLDGHRVQLHEVDGPRERALPTPPQPISRPWTPIPPSEWSVERPFDFDFLKRRAARAGEIPPGDEPAGQASDESSRR